MSTILTGLTDAQREAVIHIDGPILILAGPGSGKTRVITHRIAYLIGQGVRPYNILALTFTNKAAEEMRQRLLALQIPRGSTICTFHSLAARLLREFAEQAGISAAFSIYDTADQKVAMREAMKLCELDAKNFPPASTLARISAYKNNFQTPEQIEAGEFDYLKKITARLYTHYQDILTANAALDFDDLLMKLALLLRDDTELRDLLNNRYRYVLVDEYQDTNHCQYQITRGLALNHSNICATGDPDQSIYGWRGADIGNILAFEEDYPDSRIVRLEENFRSTPEVLDIAEKLISVNLQRREKRLLSTRASGQPCQLLQCDDEYDEADNMVQWISQLLKNGLEYRDIAVFYRVNSMSRVLEEALLHKNIPYQIIRGLEFFQRREIKDMLAYLRLLANPSDQVALRRIINQPARGIGNTTVNRLFEHSQSTGRDIWQVVNNVDDVATLNAGAKTKVKKFAKMITSLQNQVGGPVEQIMNLTYEQSGLCVAHTAEAADSEHNAVANVGELINSAVIYDQKAEEPSLADYLQQIALVSDADGYDEKAGSVSLMTLHAAKGLEFPAVLIIGLEDGILPHSRSFDRDQQKEKKNIEEERRLLFVGITRAKEILVLSYANRRAFRGESRHGILSPFLRGLDGLVCRKATCDDSFDSGPDDCFESAPDDRFDSDNEEVMAEVVRLEQGQLVRHPKMGLGRIQQVIPLRDNPKVVVQFNSGMQKTLYLKYAKLERIDSTDY